MLGKLTEACFRRVLSCMSRAFTPVGGSGSGAGSTPSRLLTTQSRVHDRSCCSISDYLWHCRCCTDRHELFYTHTADVSRAAVIQRGGLQKYLLFGLLWTPPTLPGSVHVITPASNELPSRSRCTLESNQEAHETPTASWSSWFFGVFLVCFFWGFFASSHTFPELFCI